MFNGRKPDGQVQRAIQRLGVILAGGVIAQRAGLFPIPPGEILDATLEVLRLWIAHRGGVGGLEQQEAVERTRSFLLTQDSRFERAAIDGFTSPIVHRRAGWVDGYHYHILPEAWAEIHSGSGASEAAKAVRDAGFLEMQGKNLKFPLPKTLGGDRVLVYRVNRKVLEDQDDGGSHV